MPAIELLLPLGAVAFYLWDSLQLLYQDELVVERDARWHVSSGSDLLLGGRRPYLPNPFLPHRLLFVIDWTRARAGDAAVRRAALGTLERTLAPVRGVVLVLAALLFLVLPPVSWFYGAGAALLFVFAAVYLFILVGLAFVYARRAALGLALRPLLGLALESLACAPFALNLVRKISLMHSSQLDVDLLLAEPSEPDFRRRLSSVVRQRADGTLRLEEPDSPRRRQIEAIRARLEAPSRDAP